MKSLTGMLCEGAYDMKVTISPFEKMMIWEALDEFIKSGAYEKNKAKGAYYKKEQVEAVMTKFD